MSKVKMSKVKMPKVKMSKGKNVESKNVEKSFSLFEIGEVTHRNGIIQIYQER